jgi:hypothetical protein
MRGKNNGNTPYLYGHGTQGVFGSWSDFLNNKPTTTPGVFNNVEKFENALHAERCARNLSTFIQRIQKIQEENAASAASVTPPRRRSI